MHLNSLNSISSRPYNLEMSISFFKFTEHSTVYHFTKDFLSEDQLFHLHLLAMFWSLVSFKTTSRFVSFLAVTANNHLGLNLPVGKKYPRISKMFPKLWWRDTWRWRSLKGLSKHILDPQQSNYIFLSFFMRSFWLDWTLASLLKKWSRFLFKNVNSIHFLLMSRTAVSKCSEIPSSSSKM